MQKEREEESKKISLDQQTEKGFGVRKRAIGGQKSENKIRI